MPPVPLFVPWGPDHRVVLAVTALGAIALLVGGGRMCQRNDLKLRRTVARVLLGNELISLALAAAQGRARIPLQFCDLALFMTIAALWMERPPAQLAELAYFWGLGGSLQAVLTPDLRYGFPNYWWVTFFITHCGVVLSALYLAVSGRLAPSLRSIWRGWGWANVYLAMAMPLNAIFGTNYGYLTHKPAQPSLLDYCGPWPWYIFAMEIFALASFFLSYAPFAIARRLTPRPSA